MPNGEHNHPTTTLGIVDSFLLVQPPPPNSPNHPALPSGTLGKSITVPAHLKNPFVILTSPGTHGSTLILTFFWLVGNCPYAFMKYGRSIASIDM